MLVSTVASFHQGRTSMQVRSTRANLLAVVGALLLALPASASHYHRGPTATKPHKGKHVSSSTGAGTRPRAIDDERATQIQTALVKAGYLQTASGKWDEASAEAMRKMQGDNGWQTKLIPDSRALIKLGLGPGSDVPSVPAGTSSTSGAGIPNNTAINASADLSRGQQ